MSCYKLEPREPHRCTVQVGYDPGRLSFFMYVARPLITKHGKVVGDNNGHVIEFKGFIAGEEIRTVEELESLVSKYAQLTPDVREALADDRRRAEPPPKAESAELARVVDAQA